VLRPAITSSAVEGSGVAREKMMRLSITLQGILIALEIGLPSIQATAWAQDTDADGVPDTADNCPSRNHRRESAIDHPRAAGVSWSGYLPRMSS